MPLLSRDRILGLHAATLATHLTGNRIALLGGIDAAVVASLPTGLNPSGQMLSDLHTLNSIERLADGSVPLQIWLENAIALTGQRTEADVFREVIEAIRRIENIKAIISTPIDSATSGLLDAVSSLKAELTDQGERVRHLPKSFVSGPKLAPPEDVLLSLQGIWKGPQMGRNYYVKYCDDGVLRCIYAWNGNHKPSGEYFDWKVIDKTILARYRSFVGSPSGYVYLHVETNDRLVGGWWPPTLDAELIEKLPNVGGSAPMTWLRQPSSGVAPDWVDVTFQKLQRNEPIR